MQRKIFWITFMFLGLIADFALPIWWALGATIPIFCISWWVAYRSEWFRSPNWLNPGLSGGMGDHPVQQCVHEFPRAINASVCIYDKGRLAMRSHSRRNLAGGRILDRTLDLRVRRACTFAQSPISQ
jgi:hypothetical protein